MELLALALFVWGVCGVRRQRRRTAAGEPHPPLDGARVTRVIWGAVFIFLLWTVLSGDTYL